MHPSNTLEQRTRLRTSARAQTFGRPRPPKDGIEMYPRYMPEIYRALRSAQVRVPKPSDGSLLLKMESAHKSSGKQVVEGVWRKMAQSQVLLLL